MKDGEDMRHSAHNAREHIYLSVGVYMLKCWCVSLVCCYRSCIPRYPLHLMEGGRKEYDKDMGISCLWFGARERKRVLVFLTFSLIVVLYLSALNHLALFDLPYSARSISLESTCC